MNILKAFQDSMLSVEWYDDVTGVSQLLLLLASWTFLLLPPSWTNLEKER